MALSVALVLSVRGRAEFDGAASASIGAAKGTPNLTNKRKLTVEELVVLIQRCEKCGVGVTVVVRVIVPEKPKAQSPAIKNPSNIPRPKHPVRGEPIPGHLTPERIHGGIE